MSKSFATLLICLVLFFGLAIILANYSGASAWLWQISHQGQWFLPLLAVSAIIDSINPCAFSILIVSLIFLFSLGSTTSKVLKYGLVYIAGIFAAYFLIGLGIFHALHIFDIPHFMSKVGSVMLVIFGILSILEVVWPKFPIKLGVPHSAHLKMNQLLENATLPAMFLLGGLVGLCEFPCTGGPYLMAIGLLHDAKTYWQGAGWLILYNIIFVTPLVLILLTASRPKLVEKVKALQQENKKMMKLGAGVAMILLAILILYI